MKQGKGMFEHYEKHMFDPSPHSPHTKIISYLGKNKKVLDVGCSSGYIAKELNKNGCSVFGIEIDITSAEIAKKHCEKVLVVGDMEEINGLPFSDKYSDIIIFSDILEHLKRPDITLQRLRRYLKSEIIIVASIPNVARFEVRFGLLLGKFRYHESGILSRFPLGRA